MKLLLDFTVLKIYDSAQNIIKVDNQDTRTTSKDLALVSTVYIFYAFHNFCSFCTMNVKHEIVWWAAIFLF